MIGLVKALKKPVGCSDSTDTEMSEDIDTSKTQIAKDVVMERTSNRGRPKGSRGGRGKGKRGRKPRVVVSDTEESNEVETIPQEPATIVEPEIDIATTETPAPEVVDHTPMEVKEIVDMSQLDIEAQAPTFTTMQRNVPQVMLRLNWDHKVNLIGEKVLNPMIYCCDQCEKPILIYGRMIQCKHVFCLHCARTEAVLKQCPRCKEKVIRVEQTGLGTVFMCIHGGSRYGKTGCRRTYLSQRDLQAHINHRHMTIPAPLALDIKTTEKSSSATAQIGGPQQQNSHLRKDSMVQPPPAMPHPTKHGQNQPYNPSVFPSVPPRNNDNQQSSMMGMMNSHSAANKFTHHSQEMHGFHNQGMNYGGHSFNNNNNSNNNGAGSSSSMPNNFYMGHYSQQAPPQQPQQNWNQQQQYFR